MKITLIDGSIYLIGICIGIHLGILFKQLGLSFWNLIGICIGIHLGILFKQLGLSFWKKQEVQDDD